MLKEDLARQSRDDYDSPVVADGGLVAADVETFSGQTCSSSDGETCTPASTLQGTSPAIQDSETVSGKTFRERFSKQGFSSKVCDILEASIRKSTKKQYDSYFKQWENHCIQRKTDPLSTTIADVLEFLSKLFDRGLSYSAISTAKCSIAAVAKTKDGKAIGTDTDVCRFMRGVFQLRPSKPKYSETWDVSKLFEMFRKGKDNCDLTLRELTKKLCALIMIETGQRVQTLHLIKLEDIEMKDNSCSIVITELVKQSRPGYMLPPLELKENSQDPKICSLCCLRVYLSKTNSLRSHSGGKLFICHGSPHGPASRDTISRWLKETLDEAGIKEFTSHSYRSASTSAMKRKGMTLHSIIKKAGWSGEKVFKKFYLKPIRNDNSENNNSAEQKSILNYFKKH